MMREMLEVLKAINPKAAAPTHIGFVGNGVYQVDLSDEIVKRMRTVMAEVEECLSAKSDPHKPRVTG